MEKERETFFDSCCGLIIVYMIFSHICQLCNTTETSLYRLLERILFFFMPWYFFKSGLFFKVQPLLYFIKVKSKRLLFPFILYSLIGQLMFTIIGLRGVSSCEEVIYSTAEQFLNMGCCAGNPPLWFLLSLFLSLIFFNIAIKNKYILFIMIISSGLFPFILHLLDETLPFWITNSILGTFYIGMGYLLKEKQFNKLFFVFNVILYVLILVFMPSYVGFRSNTLCYGSYLLWELGSISGIIVINNIFKQIKNTKVLEHIGKYSMDYYIIHWIIIYPSYICLNKLMDVNTIEGEILLIIISVITLPVAVKILEIVNKRLGLC